MFTRVSATVAVVVVVADMPMHMEPNLHILQNYHSDPIQSLHPEPIHPDPTLRCLLRSIPQVHLNPILQYHPILNRGCKVALLESRAAAGHCSKASNCCSHYSH